VARGRNPHSDIPVRVASWPADPDWPPADKKASRKKPVPRGPQPGEPPASRGPGDLYGPRDPQRPPGS